MLTYLAMPFYNSVSLQKTHKHRNNLDFPLENEVNDLVFGVHQNQ